jgi:Transposase, Mutator family
VTETIEPMAVQIDQQQLAEELVEKARAEGIDLVGPGELLSGLTKSVLETALEAEMGEHLGNDKHDAMGRNGGNSRNGTRAKTVLTEIGPVLIEVPRDREGTFEPTIVRKRQRRLDGIDEIVLSLTARGLTTAIVFGCRRQLGQPARMLIAWRSDPQIPSASVGFRPGGSRRSHRGPRKTSNAGGQPPAGDSAGTLTGHDHQSPLRHECWTNEHNSADDPHRPRLPRLTATRIDDPLVYPTSVLHSGSWPPTPGTRPRRSRGRMRTHRRESASSREPTC